MKNIAIIPARKGSKRLKNKNRLILGGRPLIEWTINFALKLKFIDDIIVSTDDNLLKKKIARYNKIKVFKRPTNLANDKSRTIDVIFHTIKKYEKNFNKIKTIILLQATSPYRSIKKIENGYKKYLRYKMQKSIVSVSENKKKKFSFNLSLSKNLFPNGNFYIASKNFLKKNKSFIVNGKTLPLVLKNNSLKIDIDTKQDFNFAKKIIYKKNKFKYNYV